MVKKKSLRKFGAMLLAAALLIQPMASPRMNVRAEETATEDPAAAAAAAAAEEAARLESERLESERLESERLESERLESERLESERLESERQEAARLESERLESERLESERQEAARLESEKQEAARLESERQEAARLESERQEAARLESEKQEAARLESEKQEAARLESEKAESERLESERLESERLESERLESEKALKEKESESESETKEAETEHPENNGPSISVSDLKKDMKDAWEMAVIAKFFAGEEPQEAERLFGQKAGSQLDSLKKEALKLANATSSGDVRVVNVFADEKGNLDLSAVKEAFGKEELEVGGGLAVVNIVAAKADQDLKVSGIPAKVNGNTVSFEDGKQGGVVLYSFSAYVKGKYVDYTGKVDVKADSGTFLAPAGTLELDGTLHGALWAESVTLKKNAQLEKTILLQAPAEEASEAQAPESAEPDMVVPDMVVPDAVPAEADTPSGTAADTETVPSETAAETETELPAETAAEPETELPSETAVETEIITEAETESEAATETAVETESETVTETAPETETESETVTETAPETETESETVTETAPETETESETMSETESEAVTETETSTIKVDTLKLRETVEGAIESGNAAAAMLKTRLLPLMAAAFANGEEGEQKSSESESTKETETEPPVVVFTDDVTLSMQAVRNETVLKAVSNVTAYVTLFEDEAHTVKAAEPFMLTLEAGQTEAAAVHLPALEVGKTYYPAETDAQGNLLNADSLPYKASFVWRKTVQETEQTESGATPETKTEDKAIKGFSVEDGEDVSSLFLVRTYADAYPDGEYSFDAALTVNKSFVDQKGKEHAVKGTFYVTFFADAAHTVKLADPVALKLENAAAATANIQAVLTSETVYLAETDASGTPIADGFADYYFTVRYEDGQKADTKGVYSVPCTKDAGTAAHVANVINTLEPASVTLRVTDEGGNQLSGATFVIRNSKRVPIPESNPKKYTSAAQALTLTGELEDGQYYLSQINAPEGYLPAVDVPFTVETGKRTEAVLVDKKATGTRMANVSVQVYEGDHLLYAQDTTQRTYEKQGAYTRHVALFADEARTQKVSNVQILTISGFAGNSVFRHLVDGTVYYVAETDEFGTALQNGPDYEIQYTNNGMFKAGQQTAQRIIREVYDHLPDGFRYTARLTFEKRVTDHDKNPKAVTETFYVGVYRTPDFSDVPTILTFELNNAASAVVSRRILLPESGSVTYYFAEVDKNGKQVKDSAGFNYIPTFEYDKMTLTKSSEMTNLLTNRERISNVTYYITKRVYEGTQPKKVTGTFYAGLFKDKDFKEKLYANPIPLELNNADSVTLKLSMNLGSNTSATFFVAEVDQNGNLVRSGKDFGYDIRVINARVQFDQDHTEIQSVLLNSVAGTTSEKDWETITGRTENRGDNIYNGGGAVTTNGTAAGASGVATGDETPILKYVLLLAAAAVVLITAGAGMVIVRRNRKRRRAGRRRSGRQSSRTQESSAQREKAQGSSAPKDSAQENSVQRERTQERSAQSGSTQSSTTTARSGSAARGSRRNTSMHDGGAKTGGRLWNESTSRTRNRDRKE